MYNQYTELDQKPLNLKKVLLDPMQLPKAGKRRKHKPNSKNPYKIKKIRIPGEQAMRVKRVDGFELLKLLHFEHPREIIRADISYKRIIQINADHLEFFSNLVELNCSENEIKLEWLQKLPAVQVINISHNKIKSFPLQLNGFRMLRKLNLSFNRIEHPYISHLAMIPELEQLDICSNDLRELPEDLSNFEALKKLELGGNLFSSDHKAAFFWASLSTLPNLTHLSIARNRMRGIHTEKLAAGNFSKLQILDFSFNTVQNQHNLICARNFNELKKLIVTGNPFANNGEFKGLEMEIYARTGAELIIEAVKHYYLKQEKKDRIPIRFEKIMKVENDNFTRNKNVLFGLEMPKDDQFSQSQEEEEPQPEEEPQESPEEENEEAEDDNNEGAMFMTEQLNVIKPKKQKKERANLDEIDDNQPAQEESAAINSSFPSQAPQESVMNKSINSEKSSISSRLSYEQFKKVAADILGGEKDYNRAFDINTAYKALKNVVNRARNE